MADTINVHITYAEMDYQAQYPAGTTVKEFAWKFIEDNMLDDGCFVTVNGKNMTRQLDYALQEGDNISVLPMVLSGG